jgi:signal transduction histidine kinase
LLASRIEEALASVTERWSGLHDIQVTVTTTGSPRPMPPETELTLLRTAQEALANVAKHAGATRVGLTLSYIGDQVTLDVRDDGIGFACHTGVNGGEIKGRGHGHLAGGFGLTAMRQRIEGLAGNLEIESEPGIGTTISASLPVAVAGTGR